jgi:hypothetical protein
LTDSKVRENVIEDNVEDEIVLLDTYVPEMWDSRLNPADLGD